MKVWISRIRMVYKHIHSLVSQLYAAAQDDVQNEVMKTHEL